MKTTTKFNKITSYQSDDFKKWFGNMEYPNETAVKLFNKKISRNMNDSEILSELKPTEVSPVDIFETLKTLDYDGWYLFYCKDIYGVLRTVSVYWYDYGWFVNAFPVDDSGGWIGGRQVFSRNYFDTLSSDPEILSHLKKIETKLDTLLKHLGVN